MAKVICLATLGTFLAGALLPETQDVISSEPRVMGSIVNPETPFFYEPLFDFGAYEIAKEPVLILTEPEEVVEPSTTRRYYEYPTESHWARLRFCESSDNPRAISPQGWYRGLYQFDFSTWRSVGGQGDPIDASREEQDYRAQLLYNSRGANPWPVCGRFLY